VLSIGSALTVSFAYFRYLSNIGPFLDVIVTGCVFALLHTVSFLLSRPAASVVRRRFVVGLETVALASFFFKFPDLSIWNYLGVIVLTFLLLRLGEWEAKREMDNSINFKFVKVMHPLTAKIMSLLVLFGVLLSLPGLSHDPHFFSSKSFADVAGWGFAVAQKLYPDFTKDTTIHDLGERLAEKQLANNPSFQALGPNGKKEVLSKAADDIVKNITDQANGDGGSGIEPVTPSATLEVAAYQFTSRTLANWYHKSPVPFLFAWAVVLFLIFRGFGAIVGFVIVSVAYLFYQGFLSTNVIHIAGESRMHQFIEY
jgi:hypothetical protein